jgi:murein DD-endopeptidase MepM/ murein hydrolase activator NlpD
MRQPGQYAGPSEYGRAPVRYRAPASDMSEDDVLGPFARLAAQADYREPQRLRPPLPEPEQIPERRTSGKNHRKLAVIVSSAAALALGAALETTLVVPSAAMEGSDVPGISWIQARLLPTKKPAGRPTPPAPAPPPPPKFYSDKWFWPPAGRFRAGPCFNSTRTSLGHHAGMDINVDRPDVSARAAHDGVVVRRGSDSAAGNYVTIKTLGGQRTLYYSYEHLRSINVQDGQEVNGGKTTIGTIGHSGRMFGVAANHGHLHIGLSPENKLGSYSGVSQTQLGMLDPLSVLPKPPPYGYHCTS